MALTADIYRQLTEEMRERVMPWWQEFQCRLDKSVQPWADRLLLAGILTELRELRHALNFGANYFRMTPAALNTTPTKLVEKEPSGRVRKVSIWVDAASGGPTPTIRIGTSDTSVNGGGIRINAGTVNEIGEVPPGTELWGASSTAINVYVIERA